MARLNAGLKASRLLLAALILLGAGLRWAHFEDVRRRTPDETTYVYQANVVASGGWQGSRNLIEQFKATPATWVDPTPTRIGFIWLLAAFMKLTHTNTALTGAWVSLIFSILSLCVLAWTGAEFFGSRIAAVAVFLHAVSLPSLMFSRRAWEESTIEFDGMSLILVTIFMGLKGITTRRLVAFAALGAYSVLLKDSGISTFGFWTVWLIAVTWLRERSLRAVLPVASAAVLGLVIAEALLVGVSGGFSSLAVVLRDWAVAVKSNGYANLFQTGPALRFFSGLFLVAPLATVLFLFGAFSVVHDRVRQAPGQTQASRLVLPALIVFPVLILIALRIIPGFENLRFLSPALGCFHLAAACGFGRLFKLAKDRLSPRSFSFAGVALFTGLALGGANDYLHFSRLYVADDVADLSIKMIVDESAP